MDKERKSINYCELIGVIDTETKLHHNLKVFPQIDNGNLRWVIVGYIATEILLNEPLSSQLAICFKNSENPFELNEAPMFWGELSYHYFDVFSMFDATPELIFNYAVKANYIGKSTQKISVFTVHPALIFIELCLSKKRNEYMVNLLTNLANLTLEKDLSLSDSSKEIFKVVLQQFRTSKLNFLHRISKALDLMLTGNERYDLVTSTFKQITDIRIDL